MNKRALIYGCIYAALVIIFKLVILLGGYTLTKFGFYYSNVVSILFIFPFFYLGIQQTRDKDLGGIISGRDSIKLALTILSISVIFVSMYNYIEFNWKYKDIAIEYYNSRDYFNILTAQQIAHPDKLKVENFPKIIEEQISDLSAFKATTGKLIPMLFFGFGGAFVMAMFLKRSPK
ncbi:MAG: DUF4199 domain-containing protein [bacterium]|nr:DUF4199 domain-containing protein [bacterium]